MPRLFSKENDLAALVAIQIASARSKWDKHLDLPAIIEQNLALMSVGTQNAFNTSYRNDDSFPKMYKAAVSAIVAANFSLSPAQEQQNRQANLAAAKAQRPVNATQTGTARNFLASMHHVSKVLFSSKPMTAPVVTVDPMHDYAMLLNLQTKISQQKNISQGLNIASFLNKDHVALFETLSVNTQQAFRAEFLNENNFGFKPGKAEDFLQKTELELAIRVGYEKAASRSSTPATGEPTTTVSGTEDNDFSSGFSMKLRS